MSGNYGAALAISRTLIRIGRVLNLALGVALVVALAASFVIQPTLIEFFGRTPPRIDAAWLLPAFRLWILVGGSIVAVTHVLLTRLLAMVDTVRAGDPFVPDNAARLNVIAWCALALQLVPRTFGAFAEVMNAAGASIDYDFPRDGLITDLVGVLLLFVLARVFKEGARIRGDLEAMI